MPGPLSFWEDFCVDAMFNELFKFFVEFVGGPRDAVLVSKEFATNAFGFHSFPSFNGTEGWFPFKERDVFVLDFILIRRFCIKYINP